MSTFDELRRKAARATGKEVEELRAAARKVVELYAADVDIDAAVSELEEATAFGADRGIRE